MNVTGPLGSGKTHLVHRLRDYLVMMYNVPFDSILLSLNENHNPSANKWFAKAKGSDFNQFMNQLTIQILNFEQYLDSIKQANNDPDNIILQDYSLLENMIYINEINDSGLNSFTRNQYSILNRLYIELYRKSIKPDLLIHIDLPDKITHANIIKRGRKAETDIPLLDLFVYYLKNRFIETTDNFRSENSDIEFIRIQNIDREEDSVLRTIKRLWDKKKEGKRDDKNIE